MNKRRFGMIGEKIAQNYLSSKGYDIIATNFYTKRGEIDIILKKEKCIIFVEVKTRTNLMYGTPAMSINIVKKNHIKSAANTFLYLHRYQGYDVRFDVIEIFINDGKCDINHIKGIM